MIKNYLKLSYRNLVNNKLFSFINIFGLAVAFGAALIIFQFVWFELSYDKNLSKSDLYYLEIEWQTNNGAAPVMGTFSGKGYAELFSTEVPEILEVSKSTGGIASDPVIKVINDDGNTSIYNESRAYANDSNWFRLIRYKTLYGNPEKAINELQSIILTKSMAIKYYGEVNAIGKTLHYKTNKINQDFTVAAIIDDASPNSSFAANMLLSWRHIPQDDRFKWSPDNLTIVRLKPGTDPEILQPKLRSVITPHISDYESRNNLKQIPHLVPIEGFHYRSTAENPESFDIKLSGDKDVLYLFAFLGVLLIVIGWINFINLETALSMVRVKDVCIRKVSGASKFSVITQMIFNSIAINAISLLIGLMFAQLFFPLFKLVTETKAEFTLLNQPSVWLILVLFVIVGGVLAGIYPAFMVSSGNPAQLLKGSFRTSDKGKTIRRTLIVLQLTLTVVLLGSTYSIYKQTSFLQEVDKGFDIGSSIAVKTPSADTTSIKILNHQRLQSALLDAGIANIVAVCQRFPGLNSNLSVHYSRTSDGKDAAKISLNVVDANYFTHFKMEFLAGKNFGSGMKYEYFETILTEETRRKLGFSNNEEAIGTIIYNVDYNLEFTVVGVVKDYAHFGTKGKFPAIVFGRLGEKAPAHFWDWNLIKFNENINKDILASTEAIWKKLFPDDPFDYIVVKDQYDDLYSQERSFAGIIGFFTVLGIFLSCLGLYGLSTFNTLAHTKEIGIRKVLGSRKREIVWLFSKSYIKLMFISMIFGLPLFAYGLNNWLQYYPKRIDITADLFILPVLLVVFVVFTTVSYETNKVAKTNPVDSLRAE